MVDGDFQLLFALLDRARTRFSSAVIMSSHIISLRFDGICWICLYRLLISSFTLPVENLYFLPSRCFLANPMLTRVFRYELSTALALFVVSAMSCAVAYSCVVRAIKVLRRWSGSPNKEMRCSGETALMSTRPR